MQIQYRVAVMLVLVLAAATAQAGGMGKCKSGFADGTLVRTEYRGDLTIGEVRPSDRVWSYNEMVGKEGWSRVLQRIDNQRHYKLLSEFTAPGSAEVTKACWIIQRTG